MNFGFGDNCYLWMLILALLLCGNGNGLVESILGNLGCIVPVAIALICCCNKGTTRVGNGCGCR